MLDNTNMGIGDVRPLYILNELSSGENTSSLGKNQTKPKKDMKRQVFK